MAIPGLSLSLYFDHNFDERIGLAVRRASYDIVIAREVDNERLSDEEHLRWATAHGRTIVTYDRGDFRKLNTEWAERGDVHAGIIIVLAPPRLGFRETFARLINVLETVIADEMPGQLLWLNESWSPNR